MNPGKAANLTVWEAMTPYPFVIEAKESVAVAIALMQEHGVRHLPVVSKGKPFSVVSEREISDILARQHGKRSPAEISVQEACALEAFVVTPEHPLSDILARMIEEKIGSALIVSENRVAGIFTYVDACRVLLQTLSA